MLPRAAATPGMAAVPTAFADLGTSSNSSLLIRNFSIDPTTVLIGETFHATVQVDGGTTPYSFAYAGLPPGCSSVDQSTLTCRPNASGAYSVRIDVTDSGSTSVNASRNVTVLAPPALDLIDIAFDRRNATVGAAFHIHPEVGGAVGPVTYAYPVLPSGCTGANVSTLACTPNYPGLATVRVVVSDALGRSANTSRPVLVLPANLTIAAFRATPPNSSAGAMLSLTVTLAGEVTPIAYAYTGLPPGCASVNGPVLNCTPTRPGDFAATVKVRDAWGRLANGTLALVVRDEAPPTIVSFAALPSVAVVGSLVTFQVEATGGLGWLSYSYLGFPPECATANLSEFSCVVNSTGSYSITTVVRDGFGEASKGFATLIVSGNGDSYSPHPTPLLTASPAGMGVLLGLAVLALGATIWWIRRRPT